VIEAALSQGLYNPLIKYLKMARKTLKETRIDTELIYSYAKTGDLVGLEDLVKFVGRMISS
jgi:clathrin heavy chain